MFNYRGGTAVKGGFYWNRATWHLETVDGKTGTLPGDDGTRYARVPILVMLVLAPVMGALFVVFLPFIGFALLLGVLASKARGLFRNAEVAATPSPARAGFRRAA